MSWWVKMGQGLFRMPRPFLRFCLLAVLFPYADSNALAQAPPVSPPAIRYIFVPADKPQWWPKGNWNPLRPEDLRAQLEAAKPEPPRPPTAWIEHAEYRATLVDDASLRGRFTTRVGRLGEQPAPLTLDPCNLAVSELRWSDRDAVWGTTRENTTALLVDRIQGSLEGSWSLVGRHLPGGIEFDVRVPPATVSRLLLKVPSRFRLGSTTGDVESREAEPGWTHWEIDLGSETGCRVMLRSASEAPAGQKPLVFVERSSSCVLRQGGLSGQSDFNLEVVDGSVTSLVFRIPPGMTIQSVTYGAGYPLSGRPTGTDPNRRLRFALPDPISGRGNRIRVFWTAPAEFDRPWNLPRIIIEESVHLDGQLNVTVESPLELKTSELFGFRQTAAISHADEGESFTFRQFLPDAKMNVIVGTPKLSFSARGLYYARLESDGWTLSAHVVWEAQKGSTFFTRLKLPPLWEVTGVKDIGQSENSDVVNWKVDTVANGTRALVIEFRDALSPGKRKSVEVLGRRLTVSTERPTGLPILEPIGGEHTEYLVALSYPSALIPVWLPASNPEIIARTDVPESWRDSELWTRIETSEDQRVLLLRPKTADPKTSFYFRSTKGRFEGRVRVDADVDRNEIRESYHLECIPQTEPVERVAVYVAPGAGAQAEIEWRIVEPGGTALNARRLAPSAHAEWNLPASGDLWELRLPQPRGNPFHIVGRRVKAFTADEPIPLVFLPQSSPFHGQVALFVDERLDLREQPQGLRVVAPDRWTPEPPTDVGDDVNPASDRLQRIWEYDSTDNRLGIRLEDQETFGIGTPATLALTSQMTLNGGFDLHKAVFRGVENLGRKQFRFELPRNARLIDVKVDGHKATSMREGEAFVLPPVVGLARHEVSIRYWLPASVPRFRETRTVSFPKTSLAVLRFDWRIALPPDTMLAGAPAGLRLQSPLPEISWTERLFGPLGRSPSQGIFNPFNPGRGLARWWKRPETQAGEAPGIAADVPPGWRIWKLTAPTAFGTVDVELWNAARAEQLAWVGLLFGATVTAVLRSAKLSLRWPVAGPWLLLCVAAAVLAPPVYAKIFGGLFVGTLLAALVPLGLLTFTPMRRIPVPRAPLGSTQTVERASALLLVLILACGFLLTRTGKAQENRAEGTRVAVSPPKDEHAAKVFDVLVPTDPVTNTASGANIVLVPTDLLELLGRQRMNRPEAVEYLITSAKYAGSVSDRQQVTLKAQFTVVPLALAPVLEVVIPLENGNLGGANACLVNGRPHPVLRSPRGDGLLLELSKRSDAADHPATREDGQPAAESSPEPPATDASAPATFEIELELHPRVSSAPSGESFSISIPPSVSSRLHLNVPPDVRTVSVPAARGSTAISPDGREFDVELGKTDRLEVFWSRADTPPRDVPTLDADLSCLVEAHPTWALVHHRARLRVLHGSVDFLSLILPRGTAVRSVNTDGLLRYSMVASGNGMSQLLLEFRTPRTEAFRVDVDFVIPIQSSGAHLEIPAMNLFDPAGEASRVNVVQNDVGISAAAEFHIQPIHIDSPDLTEIAVDKFLESWGPLEGGEAPQIAFQLRSPVTLALELELSTPHRTVQCSYTGRIRDDFLEWNLTADVRTLGSPTYQHVLLVDPKLQISSVSVQEDDAERLLRWSRLENRLVLFLQDKTTGAQTVILKGSLPLQGEKDIRLPVVRFEDADHEDSRILLYDASDHDVKLIGAEAYEFGEAANRLSAGNTSDVLLGGFRYRDDMQPPSIRILDDKPSTVRVDSATILERETGGGWNMTAMLRFFSTEPLSKRIRVQVPEEIVDEIKLLAPNASLRKRTLPDGSVQLVFQPAPAGASVFEVRLSARIAASVSETRQLPVPTPIRGITEESYLVVSPRDPTRPVDSNPTEITWSDAPDWLKQVQDASGAPLDDRKVYRGNASTWVVSTLITPAITADRDIPLMDTLIWPGTDRKTYGVTYLYPFGRTLTSFELNWPTRTNLVMLVADNRVIGAAQPKSGRLEVPLDESTTAHTVTIFWSHPLEGVLSRLGRLSDVLPNPKAAAVKQSLVCVVPSSRTRLLSGSGMSVLTSIDYQLDRFAGFLEICESQLSVENRINPPLWAALVQAQSAVMPQAELSEMPNGLTESQRDRFMELSRRLESLMSLAEQSPSTVAETATAVFDTGELSDVPPEIALQLPDTGELLLGNNIGPNVSYWRVNNRVVAWVLVFVGIAVVLLVNRQISICAAFAGRPHLAFAALALLWWVWLSPSFVGLLLLLSAGSLAIRDWLRTRRSAQTSIPGWSD